jgi:hypothetical protein
MDAEIAKKDRAITKATIRFALDQALIDAGVKSELHKAAHALLVDRCTLRGEVVQIQGRHGPTNLQRFVRNWSREEGAAFLSQGHVPKFGDPKFSQASSAVSAHPKFADIVSAIGDKR